MPLGFVGRFKVTFVRFYSKVASFHIEGEYTMADISKFFDKAYEGKEFSELADAPVASISGVSDADADALQKAFNIKTVRDLAENKYVKIAQAVVGLSK